MVPNSVAFEQDASLEQLLHEVRVSEREDAAGEAVDLTIAAFGDTLRATLDVDADLNLEIDEE